MIEKLIDSLKAEGHLIKQVNWYRELGLAKVELLQVETCKHEVMYRLESGDWYRLMPPEKIEVKHTWSDDHILCATIVIDGEQEQEIWWCGWEGLAALTYYNDSPTARQYVHDNELLTSPLFEVSRRLLR